MAHTRGLTLAHELVHLWLSCLPLSAATRREEEFAVNRIADALVRLDRQGDMSRSRVDAPAPTVFSSYSCTCHAGGKEDRFHRPPIIPRPLRIWSFICSEPRGMRQPDSCVVTRDFLE